MKLFQKIKTSSRYPSVSGFTLVEMMVVIVVFSFMVAAIVAVQIFAMRVYTLGATKLSATTDARQIMNSIRDQVRAAKNVYVGTYNTTNGTGFNMIPAGSLQQGNALEVLYTNTASTNEGYVIFYLDTSTTTNILYSFTNYNSDVSPGARTIRARYVTNYYCFYAEDYAGNILTTYNNNPVFHIVLQFDQWEYPIGFVGTNALNAYDFYKLSARVMRRAKD